jgi:hypothetical protein
MRFRGMQGRDLTTYYLREYETPATLGYRLPSLPGVQPVREMTPAADESAGNGRVSFSNWKYIITDIWLDRCECDTRRRRTRTAR